MKKTLIKVIAVAMVLATVACMFASCGKKLSGKYKAEIGNTSLAGTSVTYDFSGSKVKVTVEAGALGATTQTTFEGKYKIAENDEGKEEITITFEGDNKDDKEASKYSGKYAFAKGDDYITISGVKYTKVK